MTPEPVNTHGEKSAREWNVDPKAFGIALREATIRAGLTGVEAAHRLGHNNSNAVSRWWNAQVGLSDQVSYLVGLARESEIARERLLEFMGGPTVAKADSDPVLAHRLELVRRAHKRDSAAFRFYLKGLEGMLEEEERAEPQNDHTPSSRAS